MTYTDLQHEDARVTVGLRVHKGTRLQCLDEAVASLANQTYRRFKVVLLVDGPWSFGESLAKRYALPLICTGLEPDITHCSWLHRQAVAQCDTEFYKPLDYDDQILSTYLERAVKMMDQRRLDVYGCLLMSLEDGKFSARAWPHKTLDTMFTGNSDDNMLPHSSVLLRAEVARKAGNYQERAVGLGADDYHLWWRMHQVGAVFHRDDEVRNVIYRIHESNSLKIRRQRYGHSNKRKQLLAGAAAASLAIMAGQNPDAVNAKDLNDVKKPPHVEKAQPDKAAPASAKPADEFLDPPHS